MLRYLHQKDNIFYTIVLIVMLGVTAFYCTMPLFLYHGLPHSHDIIFHLFYADRFKQALEDGLIYPRWIIDANNGYGGPHFIFYSPLSYYFSAAINFIFPSPVISMIIALWFSFFLSGLTMFSALMKQSGKAVSLLVAIGYQLIPFHIIDLYARGTYAELFAFIWFPLIISFMLRINERRNRINVIGLAISYAGLIMTHLVSGFMITFVVSIYLMYHFILKRDKQVILNIVYAIIIGFGISSIYLIPVVFERQFVHIEYLLQCTVCDYTNNFLFTQEKLYILKQFFFRVHTSVIIEVILFFILILLIVRNRIGLVPSVSRGFFIILFMFSFLLTTPLSKPLWAIIPFFPILQFPWRWVIIMEISLCFLIGYTFSSESIPALTKLSFSKRIVLYIILILAVISSVMIFETPVFREEFLTDIIYSDKIRNYLTPTIEYIPRSVNIKKFMSEGTYEPVSFISGKGQYELLDWKSAKRVIKVKAATPVELRISTFYYPGWKATMDGIETPVRVEHLTGAMIIDIPEGEHILVMTFEDTLLRIIAKFISIGTCLMIVLWLIVNRGLKRD